MLAPLLLLAALAAAEPAACDPAWARVLSESVDDAGRVDFAALKRDPSTLRAQAAFAARTRPSEFSRPEARLAFLLNAYNALAMLRAVETGLEPSSKLRFFFLGKVELGGERLSLHALEDEVIRPLGDPRVHFALNCMARGCPRLPREPFAPERLESQLDAAAREFVEDPRRVRLEGGKLKLSSIFKWYEKDFLRKEPSLAAFVNRYRREPAPSGAEVEFLPYDWSLNAQPK